MTLTTQQLLRQRLLVLSIALLPGGLVALGLYAAWRHRR